MAAGDYLLCENCGGKGIYDPGLNLEGVGQLAVLCEECRDNGYQLLVYLGTPRRRD